eukprot:scaffold37097_cov52-Phaeocystis_antarctica.AAC.3
MSGGCIADAMVGAPMAFGSWAPAGRMTGACIMLGWKPAAGATIAGAYCTFSCCCSIISGAAAISRAASRALLPSRAAKKSHMPFRASIAFPPCRFAPPLRGYSAEDGRNGRNAWRSGLARWTGRSGAGARGVPLVRPGLFACSCAWCGVGGGAVGAAAGERGDLDAKNKSSKVPAAI